MEKYRKIIIIRMCFLSLLLLINFGLGVFDTFCASTEIRANEVFGFQCGITTGLSFLAIVLIVRYNKILRNDNELQKQYNKEKDERMKTIRAKAGMPMLLISSILMIVTGLIIGYSNIIAFYTLIIAAMCQMIIACIVKLVYMKIM